MSALAHATPLTDIHADVWHAHALAAPSVQVQATGDAALDAQLPGGGWPVGAMTEVLQPQGVHSEWRLLLPALARCGQGPVELPPFHGHLIVFTEGVRDVKTKAGVHNAIPPARHHSGQMGAP